MLARRIHVAPGESLTEAIARFQHENAPAALTDLVVRWAAGEVRWCAARLSEVQPKERPMAQKPSDQLAALAKAAKSGELRGVVSHAVDSLAIGPSTFAELKATLVEYDAAVDNASALGAFLRQELQAEGSNGGPPIGEKQTVTAGDVGNVADVLGNSSANLQSAAADPAPAPEPPAPTAQAAAPVPAGSPAPPPSLATLQQRGPLTPVAARNSATLTGR